jgi:hypothetical protein
VLAPVGEATWALVRDPPRGGALAERLIVLNPRTGRVLGGALTLGEAAPQDERLAASPGAVWLLRPLEGAVIRIAAGLRR